MTYPKKQCRRSSSHLKVLSNLQKAHSLAMVELMLDRSQSGETYYDRKRAGLEAMHRILDEVRGVRLPKNENPTQDLGTLSGKDNRKGTVSNDKAAKVQSIGSARAARNGEDTAAKSADSHPPRHSDANGRQESSGVTKEPEKVVFLRAKKGAAKESAAAEAKLADKATGSGSKSSVTTDQEYIAGGKTEESPTKPPLKDESTMARNGDAIRSTGDVGKEVKELGKSDDKEGERLLTGMLTSPDKKKQVAVVANKIYSKTSEIGDLDSDGSIHKPNGETSPINAEFKDWQFVGRSHKKDGSDTQNRVFTASSALSNGEFFNQEGPDKPAKKMKIEMGALIDPETGNQIATIKPPSNRGGTLVGGEITLAAENGTAIRIPLSHFENSVFSLRRLGEAGIDGKPIAGICLGKQPNGRSEFVNINDLDWQASEVKADLRSKIKNIEESSVAYQEYKKSATEEDRKRYREGPNFTPGDKNKRLDIDYVEARIERLQEKEERLNTISARYAEILRTGLANPTVLWEIGQYAREVRGMLLGSELKATKEKLDQDNRHRELEKLPSDAGKIAGTATIDGNAFTFNQGKLINASGEEVAMINQQNYTLVVKGLAKVEDGKLVVDTSQATLDKQNAGTVSIVPMGLLTGARWRLTGESESGEQKKVNWMSLGPNHNNQIASLSTETLLSYEEGHYAETADKEARSNETARILAETKVRQSKHESTLVEIYNKDSVTPEDIAYVAAGAGRHVREASWQAPDVVAARSNEKEDEAASIEKIESGRLRLGDDFYQIQAGGKLVSSHGATGEVAGQWLPGNNIYLSGRGQISLDLENQVLVELTKEGQTEQYIGMGPYRATASFGYIGGLMSLSKLQKETEEHIGIAQNASNRYLSAEKVTAVGDFAIGNRGELLEGLETSLARDGTNPHRLASQLFSDGFNRDETGSFTFSNDQFNRAVFLVQSAQGGLQWGAQETARLAEQGQQWQEDMDSMARSGVKTAVITIVTGGLINPAVSALANSAKVLAMGRMGTALVMAGGLGANALAGGAIALGVDGDQLADRGRTVLSGALEGATMGLGAGGKYIMGTSSYAEAKAIAKLSQAGIPLTAEQSRVAATLSVRLVAGGATQTEQAVAKLAYAGAENAVQAIGFVAADKVKHGENPLASHDLQTLFVSSAAGLAGDGSAAMAKFMGSSSGADLLGRINHTVLPRVIEEYHRQLDAQDRETAAKLGLDRGLVGVERLKQNRDLVCAFTEAVKSAVPSAAGAFVGHGIQSTKIKDHEGFSPQLPPLRSSNVATSRDSSERGVGRGASESEPVITTHESHGSAPQGPHKRSQTEPEYVPAAGPRKPHLEFTNAELAAAKQKEEADGRASVVSPNNIAPPVRQSQSGSNEGAQNNRQQPEAQGGRRPGAEGDRSNLRASGEGAPPKAADKPETTGTRRSSEAADASVAARATTAGRPAQTPNSPKRVNALEGRNLEAEANDNIILTIGINGQKRGTRAQQACFERIGPALSVVRVEDGKTAEEAEWCVYQSDPESAADNSKIDGIFFNKRTKKWYPCDVTQDDKRVDSRIHGDSIIQTDDSWINDKHSQYWRFNDFGKERLAARLSEMLSKAAPFDAETIPPPLLKKADAETTLRSVREFVRSLNQSNDADHREHGSAVAKAFPYLEAQCKKEYEKSSAPQEAVARIKQAQADLQSKAIGVLDQALANVLADAINRPDPSNAEEVNKRQPITSSTDDNTRRTVLRQGGTTAAMPEEFAKQANQKWRPLYDEAINSLLHSPSGENSTAQVLRRIKVLSNDMVANPESTLMPEIARLLSLQAIAEARHPAGANAGKAEQLPPPMVFPRDPLPESPQRNALQGGPPSAVNRGAANADKAAPGSAGVPPAKPENQVHPEAAHKDNAAPGSAGVPPAKPDYPIQPVGVHSVGAQSHDIVANPTPPVTAGPARSAAPEAPVSDKVSTSVGSTRNTEGASQQTEPAPEKADPEKYIQQPASKALGSTLRQFKGDIKPADVEGASKSNPVVDSILELARDRDGLDVATKNQLSRLYDDYKKGDPRAVGFVNRIALQAVTSLEKGERPGQASGPARVSRPESAESKPASITSSERKLSRAEALAELASLIVADPFIRKDKLRELRNNPNMANPAVVPLLRAAAERVHQESDRLRQSADLLQGIKQEYEAGDLAVRKEVHEAIARAASDKDTSDSAAKVATTTNVTPPTQAPARQAVVPSVPIEAGAQVARVVDGANSRSTAGVDRPQAQDIKTATNQKGPSDVPQKAAVERKASSDVPQKTPDDTEVFAETVQKNRSRENYEPDLAKLVTAPKMQNYAVYHLLALAAKQPVASNNLRVMEAAYKAGVPAVIEEANKVVLQALKGAKP